MSKQFLTSIDLNKNEILNARTQNLASPPSAPVVGQRYFDTASGAEYVYNGTVWRPTDAAKLTDGSVPISALAVDPRSRATHSGTQLAATISDLESTVQAYKLNQFATPNANIAMGGFTFTGLSTSPSAAGQAAEYSWVVNQIQASAAGIDSKPSVAVVATTNVATLSGLAQTIDSVACNTVGMRVLLVGQTTPSQNGPWVVQSGAWTRPVGETITTSAFWMVEPNAGTTSNTQWKVATTGAITLDVTSLTINQFGAQINYTDGNGILLSGTMFSLKLDTNSGLTASGTGAKILLQTNPGLTLGATGLAVQLQASSGLTLGATGLAIDTAVVVRKYAAVVGDGASLSYVVTHNLNTLDVHVTTYRNSGSYDEVGVDVEHTSVNSVTIRFAVAPASNAFRVVVQG